MRKQLKISYCIYSLIALNTFVADAQDLLLKSRWFVCTIGGGIMTNPGRYLVFSNRKGKPFAQSK